MKLLNVIPLKMKKGRWFFLCWGIGIDEISSFGETGNSPLNRFHPNYLVESSIIKEGESTAREIGGLYTFLK